MSDNVSASSVALHQYALLRLVFSHLSASSLSHLRLVCKTWNEVAQVALKDKKRSLTETFFYCSNFFPNSESSSSDEQESCERKAKRSRTKSLSATESENFLRSRLEQALKDARARPELIIHFAETYSDLLPVLSDVSACPGVLLSAFGIVGFCTTKGLREVENSRERSRHAITSIILPQNDSFQVQIMGVNSDVSNLNAHLASDEDVKAVVFLDGSESNTWSSNGSFLNALFRRQNHWFALGGGVGTVAKSFRNRICDDQDCLALIFSEKIGSNSIEAASVILPESVKSRKAAREHLSKLKKVQVPSHMRHSFGFMFACCGRGRRWYRDKADVESSLFKELFPNTPLIGFFGGGEVGLNFLPRLSEPEEVENFNEADFYHSFSTVFLIIWY